MTTFNSATLQDAFNQNHETISNTSVYVDQISQDIRSLEDYLTSANLFCDFSTSYKTSPLGKEKHCSEGDIVEHVLYWSIEKKRLMLKCVSYVGYFDVDAADTIAEVCDPNYEVSGAHVTELSSASEDMNKPLIEYPIRYRIEAYRHFSKFLEEIGSFVKSIQLTAEEKLDNEIDTIKKHLSDLTGK